MPGDPTYGSLVQKLLFGDSHIIVTSGRAPRLTAPAGRALCASRAIICTSCIQAPPSGSATRRGRTMRPCSAPPASRSRGMATAMRPPMGSTSRRCSNRSSRFQRATWPCCTPAATTRRASTRPSSNGRRSAMCSAGAACCRWWTSHIRAWPTASTRTPQGCVPCVRRSTRCSSAPASRRTSVCTASAPAP